MLINFAPQSTTGFAYDAASGSYGMLRADGSAQLDANTGTQAQFDNLLVLYSASSLRDDGLTLDYDLSFGGGVWLNGGRLWHITWTQGTDSTFVFYDADGKPLSIWFWAWCLLPLPRWAAWWICNSFSLAYARQLPLRGSPRQNRKRCVDCQSLPQ